MNRGQSAQAQLSPIFLQLFSGGCPDAARTICRQLFFRGCAGAALTIFSAVVFQRLRSRSSHQLLWRREFPFWVHSGSFWGGGAHLQTTFGHTGGPECVQAGFSWNSGCFLPRLGVPWGAFFRLCAVRGPQGRPGVAKIWPSDAQRVQEWFLNDSHPHPKCVFVLKT